MDITFDSGKNKRNIAERGISFELAVLFDWSLALIVEDTRAEYGESRFQALGPIGDRLHMLVYTPRSSCIHVISLRKANRREIKHYEAQVQSSKG